MSSRLILVPWSNIKLCSVGSRLSHDRHYVIEDRVFHFAAVSSTDSKMSRADQPAENGGEDDDHGPFGLSPDTSQYEYKNNDHFLEIQIQEFDQFEEDRTESRSPYIIFTNISPEDWRRDLVDSHNSLFLCDSYFPELGVIIIKMQTKAHIAACEAFHSLILRKLIPMNDLDLKLEYPGAAFCKTDTGTRGKDADRTYRPKIIPKERSREWPTLVLEVEVSETPRKLATDARWWISESNDDVRTVVTISINGMQNKVAFEKWTSSDVTKAPAVAYRTVLFQERDQETIIATNKDPLVIPLEDLFLRPAEGNVETDIIFGIDDLKKIATDTWRSHYDKL